MSVWLIVYLGIVFGCSFELVIEACGDEDRPHFIFTPADIYNSTKINWGGCIFLYILLIIFTPHLMLIKWLYKLFTVGRKWKTSKNEVCKAQPLSTRDKYAALLSRMYERRKPINDDVPDITSILSDFEKDIAEEIFSKLFKLVEFDGHSVFVSKDNLTKVAKQFWVEVEDK